MTEGLITPQRKKLAKQWIADHGLQVNNRQYRPHHCSPFARACQSSSFLRFQVATFCVFCVLLLLVIKLCLYIFENSPRKEREQYERFLAGVAQEAASSE